MTSGALKAFGNQAHKMDRTSAPVEIMSQTQGSSISSHIYPSHYRKHDHSRPLWLNRFIQPSIAINYRNPNTLKHKEITLYSPNRHLCFTGSRPRCSRMPAAERTSSRGRVSWNRMFHFALIHSITELNFDVLVLTSASC